MTHSSRKFAAHVLAPLCGAILTHAGAVNAASFDCAKARSYVEKTICKDEELSRLDDALAERYNAALSNSTDPERKKLRVEQLRWLKRRDSCSIRRCIQDYYEIRLSELNVDSQCPLTLCSKFAAAGADKELWVSSQNDDVQGVLAALAKGADPNVCGSDYRRPLHVAAIKGSSSVVRALLKAKAYPNIQDCPGDTPLVFAASRNDVDTAVQLLSAGANVEGGRGFNPLQAAAYRGNIEMLRTLISHRADPNAVHNDDSPPLMLAAGNWHLEAVRVLLESGAQPNYRTRIEGTALFAAVGGFRVAPLKTDEERKALQVIKLLVQHGADVNAKTAGQSPLQRARAIKAATIADFLLSAGAEP